MRPADLYRRYREELRSVVNSSLPPPAFRQAVLGLAKRLEANIARRDLRDRKTLRDEFNKEVKNDGDHASGQRHRWALVILLKAIDQAEHDNEPK